MAKFRTRKAIEKRLAKIGGTSKRTLESKRLMRKFNDILVRAKVRKIGIKSLNIHDPSDRRFLNKRKRRRK